MHVARELNISLYVDSGKRRVLGYVEAKPCGTWPASAARVVHGRPARPVRLQATLSLIWRRKKPPEAAPRPRPLTFGTGARLPRPTSRGPRVPHRRRLRHPLACRPHGCVAARPRARAPAAVRWQGMRRKAQTPDQQTPGRSATHACEPRLGQYDSCVAFRPSGWCFGRGGARRHGDVTVHEVGTVV